MIEVWFLIINMGGAPVIPTPFPSKDACVKAYNESVYVSTKYGTRSIDPTWGGMCVKGHSDVRLDRK